MLEKNKEFEPKENTIILKEPKLLPEERLYVSAYSSTLDHIKALKVVKPGLKNYSKLNTFSKRDSVKYHITKVMLSKLNTLELTSDRIMELLLQEATRLGAGSSPTARVQALTLLGKELGLFEEKKAEKENVIFNVINYSKNNNPIKEEDLAIPIKEEVLSSLPENIVIKDFSD